jgi:hypothetical protein
MCRPCSVGLEKIDTALAKSLNLFGLLLSIERDRTINPSITATTDTGEPIYINSGGKLSLTNKPDIIDELDNSEHPFLYIKAKNKAHLKKILIGKKRKYPSLNVEEALNSAVSVKESISYVTSSSKFDDKEFRSICKMAINFYMYHGGNRDLISHLISYIRDESEARCVNYYYPDGFIATSNLSESFTHTLFIKGNQQEKILYGYIELYNAFRLIVLLSDSYEGEPFEKVYSFDVLSREEVNKTININVSRKEILDLVNNSERPVEKIASAIKDLQKSIQIHIGIKDILKNISEGADVNEKMSDQSMAKKLSKEVWDLISRVGK